MKCTACGKDNVQEARFCAFCGEPLTAAPDSVPAEDPVREPAVQQPQEHAARLTAKPLSDNPYQRHRAPVIPSAPPPRDGGEPGQTRRSAADTAKPDEKAAPKRVFLFDEEIEEQEARREERAAKAEKARREAEDEFDEADEIYDDDLYDEEDEPAGGRIFVRIFSVLTVLILVVGIVSFLFGTSVGCRLRASVGLSNEAEDYMLLADWQLEQGNTTAAAASYYNAFKLEQGDYDLALRVGAGFENADEDTRAEQLYSFLIEAYPQADEPYDRLMALLMRQGRAEQYESLLAYRAEHQTGYLPPTAPAPAVPTASHEGGAYADAIQLTLTSPGAEIRYTLDGTQPTADSLLYTGPITLPAGTHSLRAVAIAGGQVSAEWSASYVIG